MKRYGILRRGAALLSLLGLLSLPCTAVGRSYYTSLPEVAEPPFLFAGAIPASDPVGMEWFADAAFIGGSQTGSLMTYRPLQAGLWLTREDLSAANAAQLTFPVNGRELSLADSLGESGCTKLYLMLGPGDAGATDDSFRAAYGALIDTMRAALPRARIYLQTFLPVTADWAQRVGPTNETIRHRNELLRQVAQDKGVYLVDVAAAFTAPNGALPDHLSVEGLHVTTEGHYIWVQYLRSHTVGT